MQSHFPNSPYFVMPLASLIQPLTTFLEEKQSYNLQFDFMLTWQHKQQRALLFAWKLHKELHPSAVKHQTLIRPTLHPWNSTRVATPNTCQLIALCLCNKLTPNLTVRYGTEAPSKKSLAWWGLACYPLEHFFLSSISTDFCLAILVSSPCAELAFFCDVTRTSTSRRLSVHLGALNDLTAPNNKA